MKKERKPSGLIEQAPMDNTCEDVNAHVWGSEIIVLVV